MVCGGMVAIVCMPIRLLSGSDCVIQSLWLTIRMVTV